MAKVLELFTEALVTVKALAVGETPGSRMTVDALNKFNEVLEALSIQNLAVYTTLKTTFPLVPNKASYTLGPSGEVVTQRPTGLDSGFVTFGLVDFPVDITKSEAEYARLALKSQPGFPEWGVYDPGYPNGTLVLWPVPDQAGTMTIYQNQQFASAAALSDDVALPPGYRKMIRLMLAWELASDYPGLSMGELEKLDLDLKGATALVKRANNQNPPLLRSEVASLGCSGGGFGNWREGA